MDVVTVLNYKGGVGKTTVTANVGADFARQGKNVLLIDLDPQSSLTLSFYEPEVWEHEIKPTRTIGHWLKSYRHRGTPQSLLPFVSTPEQAAVYLQGKGRLDLVAADLGLSDVEEGLTFELGSTSPSRSQYLRVFGRLAEALETVRSEGYDLVLIDCAPNFGILTRSAVIASDFVLVPARPDELSNLAVSHLWDRLGALRYQYDDKVGRQSVRPGLPARLRPRVLGVVFTMVKRQSGDRVTLSHRTFVKKIEKNYQIFETMIWESVNYAKAPAEGVPIVLCKPPPDGVAEQWRALALELTKRMGAPARV